MRRDNAHRHRRSKIDLGILVDPGMSLDALRTPLRVWEAARNFRIPFLQAWGGANWDVPLPGRRSRDTTRSWEWDAVPTIRQRMRSRTTNRAPRPHAFQRTTTEGT